MHPTAGGIWLDGVLQKGPVSSQTGDQEVGSRCDELRRQRPEPRRIAVGGALVDLEIAALTVAQLGQPRDQVGHVFAFANRQHQHADAKAADHSLGLRHRGQQRTGQKQAPPHSIAWSAAARSEGWPFVGGQDPECMVEKRITPERIRLPLPCTRPSLLEAQWRVHGLPDRERLARS